MSPSPSPLPDDDAEGTRAKGRDIIDELSWQEELDWQPLIPREAMRASADDAMRDLFDSLDGETLSLDDM